MLYGRNALRKSNPKNRQIYCAYLIERKWEDTFTILKRERERENL